MGGSGIVSNLDALEADSLGHPIPTTAGRTGVAVNLLLLARQGVCFPHFTPLQVEVLVPPAVDRYCSDIDVVILPGFQALQGDRQSGE